MSAQERIAEALTVAIADWAASDGRRGKYLLAAGPGVVARAVLASGWLARIRAEAWNEGHQAGALWDYSQHTDEAYSPDANPYRIGDDQ